MPGPEREPMDLEATVLLLTLSDRDAANAHDKLAQVAIRSRRCASVDELIGLVVEGSGPIVAASEVLDLRSLGRLEAALEDQPSWSNPPLVILVGRAGLPRFLRRLALRSNCTLLQRPAAAATFVSTIRAAVQSRIRQYQVRDLLRRLENRALRIERLAFERDLAEERERQRLAQILHDDLQQILAGACFQTDLLPRRARSGDLDQAVAELSKVLRLAMERSRWLAHDLDPPLLRQQGLIAALGWLTGQMEMLHGLTVRLDLDEGAEPEAMPLRMFMFRSTQELLFNVVKHARVQEAHVLLRRDGSIIELTVSDRGSGMDATLLERGGGAGLGFGLLSIRDRASLLGGRLRIRSGPGEGSVFRLVMPNIAQQEVDQGSGGGIRPDAAQPPSAR